MCTSVCRLPASLPSAYYVIGSLYDLQFLIHSTFVLVTMNVNVSVLIQTEIASPFDGLKADVYLFNGMHSKGHKCL